MFRYNCNNANNIFKDKVLDELLSDDEQDLFADEMDELEIAGLDIMELFLMNKEERCKAIKKVGLNSDSYDFD